MKKQLLFRFIVMIAVLSPVQNAQAANPWAAIIKAAVKKVVKAVDLMIQRKQNKVIKLQNAQKAIENTMAKLKLDEISEWVKKQHDLYQQYYKELKKIKSVISYYFKIKEIANKHVKLTEQYQSFWILFQNDNNFTTEERAYMKDVFEGIMKSSAKNLELLALIVKSFATEMTDAQRLKLIDDVAYKTDQLFDDLSQFNDQSIILSISRSKSRTDILKTKMLYGID